MGRANPLVRPGTVIGGDVSGLPLDKFDGRPCTWLVGVTPKDWARRHGAGVARAEPLDSARDG